MSATTTHDPSTGRTFVAPWPADELERVVNCPVCEAKERATLHEGLTDRVFFCAPGVWTLYSCTKCGSAYLGPRPTPANIGRAYGEYFTHAGSDVLSASALSMRRRVRRALANGYRNWRFGTRLTPASSLGIGMAYMFPGLRTRLDATFRYLRKADTHGTRLLDIGAGNGDFLMVARSAGWTVTGVEPDAKAVAVCCERGLDVKQGGIEQLDNEHACFDYITISHVIEHVHDPHAVLSRAFDLLKPGGTLYLDTPNIDAYGHKRFGLYWRGLEPPRHLVLFNWKSLEQLLDNIGFSALERLPRSGIYAWAAAQSRAMQLGDDPYQAATSSIFYKLQQLALGLKLRVSHTDSEFVTLLAHKNPSAT